MHKSEALFIRVLIDLKMEMTKELIQTIDNCLNIDFKQGCFGISYGIIFKLKDIRQLFINSDGNIYPDIKTTDNNR